MKPNHAGLFAAALLSLGMLLAGAGCATVIYSPTQKYAPNLSYSEASDELVKALKGNGIWVRRKCCTIVDVKVSTNSLDIVYWNKNSFGFETRKTGQETICLKSLSVPPVRAQHMKWHCAMDFDHGPRLVFRTRDAGISCANALLVLSRFAQ